MKFEKAHEAFIQSHLQRRTGERRGRLERGHQHGEILFLRNIWWPYKGNFDGLHPEYEVPDWRGRSYYGDFAYLPGTVKFLIEVKGYGPHVRDTDRKRYCDELNREIFLQSMGFRVLAFAYDDVEQRPEVCLTLLRMVLNRYQPGVAPVDRPMLAETEIVRLAMSLLRPIRPIDVARHFNLNHRTALRHLQALCGKGWLRPVLSGKGSKVLEYELLRDCWDYLN